MKTYNDIEQKMKQVASKEATPAPAFVWDNVKSALNENKRDRKGFIWMFLGGLLLFGTYFLFQNNIIEENNSLAINTTGITDIVKEEKAIIAPVVTKKETTEKGISNSKSERYKAIESVKNDALPTEVVSMKSSISSVEKSSTSSSELEKNTFAKNEVTTFKKQAIEEKTVVQRVENISKIAHLDLEELAFGFPKLAFNRNKIACPSFGGKTINLNPFIEMNGIGGMHFKNLDGRANQSLSEARSQTEKSWYSFGGNVAVGLNLTNALYLGAGIEWSQAVDEFYYSDDAVTQMVITFDPETSLPIDTSLVLGMLENKGDVRHTMIDIPVFIGLTKQFRTFELGLEAGLLYNLSFKAAGKIINEDLDISKISDENTIYKKDLGFGLRTSLIFRKTMANGLSFQVKPTFKMYLDDINHADYILPTTLKFGRLDVGLRKDF